jgi:hypothetical protein
MQALPPFYDHLWVKPFTGDADTQRAHHEDTPGFPAPWEDPQLSGSKLFQINFSNKFTAWLVVQNVEWSAHDHSERCFVFLHNFTWSFAINVAVNQRKKLGLRCTPNEGSVNIEGGGVKKGRGTDRLVLTGPVFNNSIGTRWSRVPHRDPPP